MAEVVTLTTPVPRPTLVTYRVTDLYLSFNPPTGSSVRIGLMGSTGERLVKEYQDSGPGAAAVATIMLTALNKANLATQSLQSRVMARLIADGVIAGSVTGAPD